MKKLLLITLLLGSIVFTSCKKDETPEPQLLVESVDTTNTDTTQVINPTPKEYSEIWVINALESNSGEVEFDSLKVVNRTEYQMDNGDHCYNLFGDSVRTSTGKLYVPEVFVNLDNGQAFFKRTIILPNYEVKISYMYYGGLSNNDTKLTLVFKEDEPYIANKTIVFDKIK